MGRETSQGVTATHEAHPCRLRGSRVEWAKSLARPTDAVCRETRFCYADAHARYDEQHFASAVPGQKCLQVFG